MNSGATSQSGDFTIFGFTRDPGFIEHRLTARLGITPSTISIGSIGQFFYYTTYGEVAELDEVVVLKLGFLRSKTKSALNARQLLEQKLVGPRSINVDSFSGNGLVIGISKADPAFAAFQTLMSVPQLYYSVLNDGIICSDVLRCIVKVTPHVELDESILSQHFLFRSIYGSSTYFRDVKRLIPGYYLQWEDGTIECRLVRSLDTITDESQMIRNEVKALHQISESLNDVVTDYNRQVTFSGHSAATLLSGGVDSSLIQFFINQIPQKQTWRSISFTIQVPTFEFEIEYAKEASQLLQTDHTFVDYGPEDYPDLLVRTIETLAQPPNLETEPSFLAVAEFIQAQNWVENTFFTGQGGDTLFGGEAARKLKVLHYIRQFPFAVPLLGNIGKYLANVDSRFSPTLIKGSEIIASETNPNAYVSPTNSVCVYVLDENWDIIRRCFGDNVLKETLAFRRYLVGKYSNSQHYLDQVYFIDLTTDLWELGIQRQQIFLTHKIQQVSPFFDEDIIKAALCIHPDIRYIKGLRFKHLLRKLLNQKIHAPVAHKRKGPSTVNDDLVAWMLSGPLRPLVEDIDRPDFMSKADFDRLIKKPDYFVWPLLTLDIFKKRILNNRS